MLIIPPRTNFKMNKNNDINDHCVPQAFLLEHRNREFLQWKKKIFFLTNSENQSYLLSKLTQFVTEAFAAVQTHHAKKHGERKK